MKNLKKVLALGLAFATAFTMFASAAFTDAADIKTTEAVDMLVALGVVQGNPDGSFKPDATVTRAEMAKMIYVTRTGKDDAAAFVSAPSSFTDINSHWAAGYIKYCQSLGIIAGRSATTFAPDATVTGSEAAKMLLVNLGYDATKAGLIGLTWEQKTTALADENGLLDDVNTPMSLACPRQYAAQLIYNAVDAPTVKLRDGEYTNMADDGKAFPTMGRKFLGLYTNVGTLVNINEDNLTIVQTGTEQDAPDTVFTKVATDYSALLGQKVRVMFKDGKANKVIGVYADETNKTYTTPISKVEKDGAKVKFGGSSYSLEDAGVQVYIDGDAVTGKKGLAYFVQPTSANTVTFIDSDSNNKIDTAYIKAVKVEKVTFVSSSSIVAGGVTYKFDDNTVVDGLKKDDWVIVSKNLYKDNNDVVKADKVTGTIEGYKDASQEYKVDGTWYKTYNGSKLDDVSAGNKAEIVAVNGIIFYAKKVSGTVGTPDVALVVAKGTDIQGKQVKLAFVDGTTKIVEYKAGTDTADADIVPGTVFEYEVSGTEYKLTKLDAGNDYGDYDLESGNAVATGTYNGTAIADDAKIFLYVAGDAKVVTGKQMKTLAVANSGDGKVNDVGIAGFSSKVDGLTKISLAAVTINGTTLPDNFTTNDNYGYITSDAYKADSEYIAYEMWNGTENVSVKEKAGSTAGKVKGAVVGYGSIADGIIKDVNVYTLTTPAGANGNTLYVGAIKGVTSNQDKVTFDSQNQNKITSDTVVLYVDSNAKDAVDVGLAGGDIVEADKLNDIYIDNAMYILDTSKADADLTVLIIDVKGRMSSTKSWGVTASVGGDATEAITIKDSDGIVTADGTKGEILTIEVKAKAAGAAKLTLANAVFADDSKAVKSLTFAAKDEVQTVQIVLDGVAAAKITAANA